MSRNCFNSEFLPLSMGRSVGLAPPHYFAMEIWSSSPYINRFLSADTIVPGYTNPQNLNRYSYVLNNPIKLTDPTGHKCVGEQEECLNEKGKRINGVGGLPPKKKSKDSETSVSENPTTFISSGDPGYDPSTDIDTYTDFVIKMKYGIDLLQDWAKAEKLVNKGFLLTKAINPDPIGDFVFGFVGQTISDLDNKELTLSQRGKRSGIVGIESAITGVLSNGFGAAGFVAGEMIVPEGGGIVGYPVAAVGSSLYIDGVVWENVISNYFNMSP